MKFFLALFSCLSVTSAFNVALPLTRTTILGGLSATVLDETDTTCLENTARYCLDNVCSREDRQALANRLDEQAALWQEQVLTELLHVGQGLGECQSLMQVKNLEHSIPYDSMQRMALFNTAQLCTEVELNACSIDDFEALCFRLKEQCQIVAHRAAHLTLLSKLLNNANQQNKSLSSLEIDELMEEVRDTLSAEYQEQVDREVYF